MRIVFSNFDAPTNPWYAGGGATAIHQIARRLARHHHVTVVTGAYPEAHDDNPDEVEYRRIGFAHAGPKLGQMLFSAALPLAVRRLKHDVWVESLTPPFSTGMVPWFTKRPVVALTQILGGAGMTGKYRLPFDQIERLGMRHYRHAIALSEVLKEQLLAMNPRLDVAVIPNGVSDALIARIPQKSERHVLFLGRLDRAHKGLDLLLTAWSGLPESAPPLVIAGAGSAEQESWLRRHPVVATRHVRLAGRVDGADKLKLMDEAMFLVMPRV